MFLSRLAAWLADMDSIDGGGQPFECYVTERNQTASLPTKLYRRAATP
jgi:hypothetical protein